MKKKHIPLFLFLCLYAIITKAQGIEINTIQLTKIQWEAPIMGDDTLLKTNDVDFTVKCKAVCNAPLLKGDFSIWVNNKKIEKSNATLQNNVLEVKLHLSPEQDHYLYIIVSKGSKDILTTSAVHIARIKKRFALLIANSYYRQNGRFPSLEDVPIQDIRFLGKSLTTLGFKVDTSINQTREQILDTLDAFVKKAYKSDMIFYYYSGHGTQAEGKNYLVPIDANINNSNDISNRAVEVQSMITKLDEAQALSKIVVLDACRSPIARGNSKSGNGIKGFTPIAGIKVASGTLIVSSTQPNEEALNNGHFAQYLAEILVKDYNQKKSTVSQKFRDVRNKVIDTSHSQQDPEIIDRLINDIYF